MQTALTTLATAFNTNFTQILSITVSGWSSVLSAFSVAHSGISAHSSAISGTLSSLAGSFRSSMGSIIGSANSAAAAVNSAAASIAAAVSRAASAAASMPSGGGVSRAMGVDRVPYDNYPIMAHEGEKLLTKREANQYEAATSTRGVRFIQ